MGEKKHKPKAYNSSERGAQKNSEENRNTKKAIYGYDDSGKSEKNSTTHDARLEVQIVADDDPHSKPSPALRRKVNAELANYFYHITSLFEGNSVDLEEKPVICSSALHETRGEELAVATDVVLSHTLQMLLQGCDLGALCGFLSSSAGVFSHIATDKCGSHVAETALKALLLHLQDPETSISEIEAILMKISEALILDSASVMLSPYGSHVLRSLICLCKGVAADSLEEYHVSKSSAILAERLNFKDSRSGGKSQWKSQCRFPEVFKVLVTEMLREAKDQVADLCVNKYSSFVLQTVLKLLAEDEEGLLPVILLVLGCPEERALGDVQISAEDAPKIVDLIEDTASSHLLEVIIGVAPESLYDEFLSKVFRGSLAKISMHQCGNFVVQALLSSAKSKAHVALIWEELHPLLRQLLENGKSGVIASLLAACHRLQTHGLECGRALVNAVCTGSESTDAVVPRLLFLERFASCGDSSWEWPSWEEKMHTVGCLMLQIIFRFPRKMIQPYIRSILSMDADQVVQTARDTGGGRVLEAFLCSDCSFQQKISVIGKLQGCFGELSLNPSGSFTVEKCFDAGGISLKSTIASELLDVRTELSKKKHGTYIIKKVDMDGFQSRPEQWMRRQENRDHTYREFQAAFGSGKNKRHSEGGHILVSSSTQKERDEKTKKKKQKAAGMATAKDGVAAKLTGLDISMAKLGLPEANNKVRKRKRAPDNMSGRGGKPFIENTSSRANVDAADKKIPFLRQGREPRQKR